MQALTNSTGPLLSLLAPHFCLLAPYFVYWPLTLSTGPLPPYSTYRTLGTTGTRRVDRRSGRRQHPLQPYPYPYPHPHPYPYPYPYPYP